MVPEQLDRHIKKKKKNPDTNLILFTEINLRWIIDLNVKWKTLKLLENNIGENLDDLRYSKRVTSLAKEWEKMFSKGTYDKRLLYKIYKKLLKVNNK